jgi:hypothetical protein
MDPPDDDIQFDFFEEEPATAETTSQPRGRLPQRQPRQAAAGGGAVASAHPTGPILRLLAIICIAIFLVLVFALLIQSCAGQSSHDLYGNYMDKVGTIAAQSNRDGAGTVSALTTPGLSAQQISRKLRQIYTQEQQNVAAAQDLSVPGKLRTQHAHLIESLQLRASGVQGLSTALSKVNSKTKESVEAALMVQQVYRLLTSDVIWSDLFQAPSEAVLDQEGVRQVTVPASHFLAVPDALITVKAMSLILDRIMGSTSSSTGTTGLHGTNISQTAALPNGAGGTSQVLTAGTALNTVTTSSSLVFQVTIFNGGTSQEVQIPVTLTIDRPASQGGAITKNEKVQLVDPGQYASVTFSDLGQVPFASPTKVHVDVAPVPGETNTTNNSAVYNVIFSLPS